MSDLNVDIDCLKYFFTQMKEGTLEHIKHEGIEMYEMSIDLGFFIRSLGVEKMYFPHAYEGNTHIVAFRKEDVDKLVGKVDVIQSLMDDIEAKYCKTKEEIEVANNMLRRKKMILDQYRGELYRAFCDLK